MATQVLGAARRSRLIAVSVALAFTCAILVLAVQAHSILSTPTGMYYSRVPARFDPCPYRNECRSLTRGPTGHHPTLIDSCPYRNECRSSFTRGQRVHRPSS